MWLLFWGTICAALLQILWQWWKHRSLPSPFWSAPLIGDSLTFFRNPAQFCTARHRFHGPFTRAAILGREVLMIADPAAIAQVFGAEGKGLRLWVPPARRLLEGVDVLIGDRDQTKHIVVRKELLSLFNTDAMSCHFETMKSIMQTHIRDWADKGSAPFPILSSLEEMTFAIVYGCLIDKADKDNKKKLRQCDRIASHSESLMALPFDLPGTSMREALRAREELKKDITKLFAAARHQNNNPKQFIKDDNTNLKGESEREEDPAATPTSTRDSTEERSVVGKLVSLKGEIKKSEHAIDVEDEELANSLLQILLSGYQSLVPALRSTIKLLAKHPNVLDNVKRLVRKVAPDPTPLTYEHIQSMVYLDAVVKEVLRLHPPVEFSFREVTAAEFTIGSYTLHKGDMAMLHYPSIHNASFTAPNLFDPSRFDQYCPTYSTLYAYDDRRAYHPFGGGSRSCIGMKFAMAVLQTFVALLAKERLHIEASKPQKKELAELYVRCLREEEGYEKEQEIAE